MKTNYISIFLALTTCFFYSCTSHPSFKNSTEAVEACKNKLTEIQAIKDADSVDPAAIKDALKNVHVEGVTGDITFDENGDANKDMAYIKKFKIQLIAFFLEIQPLI